MIFITFMLNSTVHINTALKFFLRFSSRITLFVTTEFKNSLSFKTKCFENIKAQQKARYCYEIICIKLFVSFIFMYPRCLNK